MRLICPHCMSGVTVADDTAGKEATCPNCGRSFPTPARYSAAVVPEAAAAVASAAAAPPSGAVPPTPPPVPGAPSAPTPPPGYVPPAPSAPDGFLPSSRAATPELAGYTHARGITISPKVVAWLPAALLTVVFVLTFFPWVGSYAGESAVYSQRPWGAMFGLKPNRNFKFEQNAAVQSDWIDKMNGDWLLLIPFFSLLFAALAFAWAERGLGTLDPRKVPPLVKLWPWRNTIVLGCATLALLFLLWQIANGFSMERAIQKQISDKFAERREKETSPSKLDTLKYEEEQAYNAYNVERTTWLYLALLCNALAVGATATRIALDKRGNKPAPKIVLHY
ncbi:unnamed protein product [Gemmata massiliana]|uniref:Zinc finger/thioredoxin putative domain-containing protein n=1 Tax=Gemmata massiliana TaxID=1210884 RepID=A0A6P2CRA6_9BACT|nr:hypothetical protein [Gemmata massiliana]VTR91511.1 unnamed protein product [Gemmata massiliana]